MPTAEGTMIVSKRSLNLLCQLTNGANVLDDEGEGNDRYGKDERSIVVLSKLIPIHDARL